jgi:hypothetical protein
MFRPEAINWLAVLLAAVAHQAIGFLWYGPLFGRLWMERRGLSREQVAAGGGGAIAVATVASLVMSAAFALLLTIPPNVSVVNGVVWGLVLGAGFVATTTIINGVFEARDRTVIVLYAAYEIVALMVMGAILGALR